MSGTAGLLGRLAIGDNLHILREYVDDESIDLIYLDPPFNSNRAYSLIFKDSARGPSEAQAVAFKDQWTWNEGTEARFRDLLIPSVGSRATTRLSRLLANQVAAFERTQLAAYLVEMAVRLVELHRVLKPTGSLYLHCDPTASHYLKVVLDAIFGARNFVNEVAWKRAGAHSDSAQGSKHFGRLHDVILVYARSPAYTWNEQYEPLAENYVKSHYPFTEQGTGRRFGLTDLTGPGGAAKGNPRYDVMGVTKHWRYSRARMAALIAEGRIVQPSPNAVPRYKRYLDESGGRSVQDLWDDISPINSQAKERIGYPTQKPLALLGRIIATGSNPGDIVLDPFCGCGTAIEAARDLGRRWIGIDISVRALDVVNERFQRAYGEDVPYRVLAPADVETARRLAEAKPHGRREFEAWALTLIGARKNVDQDRGVDGLIPFIGPRGRIQHALVSVKSGRVSPSEVRDLVGAVHRERSPAGIFVTLGAPTKEMRLEAARATSLIPGIPRIQIITIRDALHEDRPARPILPEYRQGELFEAIPEGSSPLVSDLEDELREAIARGTEAKVDGQRDWRKRIVETMRQVLEAEPDSPAAPSPAEPRSPRSSRRDR